MGGNKKVAGIILFWVGIVVIISCLILSAIAFMTNNEDEIIGAAVLFGAILLPIIFISIIILIIGITLYFVGRSQAKKKKNQNIPLA